MKKKLIVIAISFCTMFSVNHKAKADMFGGDGVPRMALV